MAGNIQARKIDYEHDYEYEHEEAKVDLRNSIVGPCNSIFEAADQVSGIVREVIAVLSDLRCVPNFLTRAPIRGGVAKLEKRIDQSAHTLESLLHDGPLVPLREREFAAVG